MKIYRLTNSKEIDIIVTYDDPINAYLKIVYANKQSILIKLTILETIEQLAKTNLIDKNLGRLLAKDFSQLKDRTVTLPDSFLVTPFTCFNNVNEYSLSKNSKKEASLYSGSDLEYLPSIFEKLTTTTTTTNNKNFGPTTLREESHYERWAREEAEERAEINQAIFLSTRNDKKEIEEALSLSIKDIKHLPNLLDAATATYTKEVNSNFYNTAINNSNTNPNSYLFFKFGSDVQIADRCKHNISNFICEFQRDAKGIILFISSPEGDKEKLRVSSKNKNDILGCENLSDLALILENIDEEHYITQVIKQYVESEQEIAETFSSSQLS